MKKQKVKVILDCRNKELKYVFRNNDIFSAIKLLRKAGKKPFRVIDKLI
jgi:hypothetical protein